MKIYLIRHADHDESDALTELGKRQSEILGESLRGKGVTRVFSSSRIRAKETAAIAAQVLSVPHEVLPDLEEFAELKLNETIEECGYRAAEGVKKAAANRFGETLAFVLHSNLIRYLLAGAGFPKYLEEEYVLKHTQTVTVDFDGKSFRVLDYAA